MSKESHVRIVWLGIVAAVAGALVAFTVGPRDVAAGAGIASLVLFAVASYKVSLPRREERGFVDRDTFVAALDTALKAGSPQDRSSKALPTVFALELDHSKQLEERQSHETRAAFLRQCKERIDGALGPGDQAVRLEGACFVISTAPPQLFTLEDAIRFAARLQTALGAPARILGSNIHASFSVGFAVPDRLGTAATPPTVTGEDLVHAAMNAMIEAQRSGPGAIRSFSQAMRDRIDGRKRLSQEVRAALENGEIRPFFQPQTVTQTGELTGFETLARWHHPDRGMIPPSEFLPAIEEAGLMDRLGHLMVREALCAMRHWEDAGLTVPQVGVNFATHELSDPNLADHIERALVQHGLTPDRLTIEVLETVVAGQRDDVIVRNLSRLASMGCRLDLDDFGTGHASITAIRRFSIARIKIDRTFVTRIDEDVEQQAMVAAILTMADRLGLEALAEGVETEAELAMLKHLGCAYVQGFGIARPMPLEETDRWIAHYRGRASGPVPLRTARSA